MTTEHGNMDNASSQMLKRNGYPTMAGLYRNNEAIKYDDKIEQWMRNIVLENRFDTYDDLHIDQINERLKDRSTWISGGLNALRTAMELRDRLEFDFTVAVAWSLRTEGTPKTLHFAQWQRLESEMDWSPPSLYIFHRGKEPWNDIEVRTRDVKIALVERISRGDLSDEFSGYWCYIEFMRNDELSRTAFMLG